MTRTLTLLVTLLVLLAAVAALGAPAGKKSLEPCERRRECASGRCTRGLCEGRKVERFGPCRKDRECGAGLRCTGDVAGRRNRERQRGDGKSGFCENKSRKRNFVGWWSHWLLPKVEASFSRMRLESRRVPVVLGSDAVLGYYKLHAVHKRLTPFKHQFTGRVTVVRVLLPERREGAVGAGAGTRYDTAYMVDTPIGRVWSFDHHVFSLEEWRQKYPALEADRVELICSARRDGGIFQAIAIYVAKKGGKTTGWVFATGFASGVEASHYALKAKRTPGAGGAADKVTGSVAHVPHPIALTPLMDSKGSYSMDVKWREESGHPGSIVINSFRGDEQEDRPYMRVHLRYEVLDAENPPPGEKAFAHVFEAMNRMEYITQAMGFRLTERPKILHGRALRKAEKMEWTIKPELGGTVFPDEADKYAKTIEEARAAGRARKDATPTRADVYDQLPWMHEDEIAEATKALAEPDQD